MTLSPKMTTSSSPLPCRRVKMFRLALLLALTSRAQTPTRPIGSILAVIKVNLMSHRVVSRGSLHRSLLLGLAAPLATVLPLGCLCCVRLRDRRGAGGLDNGPELQESRCCLAALGALDDDSFRALTGTRQNRQSRLKFILTRMQRFRTLVLWLRVGSYRYRVCCCRSRSYSFAFC